LFRQKYTCIRGNPPGLGVSTPVFSAKDNDPGKDSTARDYVTVQK
jgi:hypothetical protein